MKHTKMYSFAISYKKKALDKNVDLKMWVETKTQALHYLNTQKINIISSTFRCLYSYTRICLQKKREREKPRLLKSQKILSNSFDFIEELENKKHHHVFRIIQVPPQQQLLKNANKKKRAKIKFFCFVK